MDFWSYFLIITGTIFMIAELIIPGGVVAPLGLGLLVVFLTRYLGLVTSHEPLIIIWMVSSLSMMIIARMILSKVTPGDSITENIEEKFDAYGTIVEVVDTIKPGENGGRIRYQGTSWKAVSVSKIIESGKKAKLIDHDSDNGVWIVETLTDLEIDKLEIEKK